MKPEAEAPPRGAARRERGVILVAVLWIALLIGLLGGAMALLAQVDGRRVESVQRRAAADALADAAFNLAVLRLMREDPAVSQAMLDKTPLEMTLPGGTALVMIENEAERVELNSADITVLTEMFVTAGVDQDEAANLAAAVIDFRDGDDLKQVNGAEAPEYRLAGLPYEPRNGPFLDATELVWVYGVDPGLARRVAADLATANTHRGARAIARRSGFAMNAASSANDATALLRRPANARRTAFRLLVQARAADGAQARLISVIAPSTTGETLFDVLEWSRQ